MPKIMKQKAKKPERNLKLKETLDTLFWWDKRGLLLLSDSKGKTPPSNRDHGTFTGGHSASSPSSCLHASFSSLDFSFCRLCRARRTVARSPRLPMT